MTHHGGIVFEQINAPQEITLQASGEGSLLVFKSAILCRAEVNKNYDEILPEGIIELSATIGGRPIDVDHNEAMNIGVFTAGRPIVADGVPALSVDGMVWADRFPDEARGIREGAYPLSVEADAKTAKCSVCGGTYTTASEYCEHLRSRRVSKAIRKLGGLKAVGGAITVKTRPAGTGTKFDPASIYFVASHDDHTLEGKWFSPLTEGELADGDFAWLSNAYRAGKEPKSSGRKLPYKVNGKVSEEGWKAAWTRAHQEGTDFSGGPSREAVIAKLKRDKPKGVEISESVEVNMAKIKCPECGYEMDAKDEEGEKANAALQAQLETLQKEHEARIAGLAAQMEQARQNLEASQNALQASQAKLVEAENEKRDAEMRLRHTALANISDVDWQKIEKAVSTMTDEAFDLFVTTYNRHQFALTGRYPLLRMPDPSLAASDKPDKEALTL
jgi:uncharacterized Zn finger protein (UPF0148 family)